MRTLVLLAIAVGTLADSSAAQQAPTPAIRDSARRDSVTIVPEIRVTRSATALRTVPVAVDVLDRNAIRRGQATLGLDEALNNLPGVYVANRYNFSQDQRLSIRGAGSRANFGARGVKILLDGVPQTLPDGQSQLTNIDFGALDRVEVLRGASSSLYGNASGGVLSLTSEAAGLSPFSQRVRATFGSYGLDKWQAFTTVRSGTTSATLNVSRLTSTGFRQQSYADIQTLNSSLVVAPTSNSTLTIRLNWADAPLSGNAGALTPAEYAVNRDSAAGNNILRRADKDVDQQQVSVAYRWASADGFEADVTAFALWRDLGSPLAAPPPGPGSPTLGTFVAINRKVQGFRASGARRFGVTERAPRLTLGLDLQRQADYRTNARALAGVPQQALLLVQQENVTEVGPFAQAAWSPVERLNVFASGRFDRVRFDVTDFFVQDGNNGGTRNLDSYNGSLGVSADLQREFTPYATIGTAFETPTTTELVNQPNGTGGFNTELQPQKTRNLEVGARGQWRQHVTYSVAAFRADIRDAIVQFREVGGRAFFQNAGRTRNQGLEFGLSVSPIRQVRAFGSYTFADYTFRDYAIVNGTTTTQLAGNRAAGVPRHFTRLGLRTEPYRTLVVDIDHTISTGLFADDTNTQFVDGYNATNVRGSFAAELGSLGVAPFIGINNLFGNAYVGTVTINGAFNRTLEPAPLRNFYAGGEISFRLPVR